jgi:hypothetical protein
MPGRVGMELMIYSLKEMREIMELRELTELEFL